MGEFERKQLMRKVNRLERAEDQRERLRATLKDAVCMALSLVSLWIIFFWANM